MRVPCAGTPSTVWVPRSILFPSAPPMRIVVANGVAGTAEVVAKNVLVPAAIGTGGVGTPRLNVVPAFPGGIGGIGGIAGIGILDAVFVCASSVQWICATGSSIMI